MKVSFIRMWRKLVFICKAVPKTRFEKEVQGNSEIAYLVTTVSVIAAGDQTAYKKEHNFFTCNTAIY